MNKTNKNKIDINLRIIFSVTLMSVLGIASINPALPGIGSAFNISPSQTSMLIAVFAIPGIIMTPILGILADRYGRKRVIIPSLLLFGVAGTACMFARDFDLLLVFRFLQGLGAASLGALNVTLIGDLYSAEKRGSIMGYNNSVLSLGTAVSPIIGGALAIPGWYYPFLLPLLALPVAYLTMKKLENPEPASDLQFKEYMKQFFKIIKNRRISGLFILSINTFIILFGAFLAYLPFLLKESFDANPFTIGIFLSSMSFTQAITASQLGRLMNKISKKALLGFSFFFYALAFVMFPLVPALWLVLLPTIVLGIAQGLNVPNVQSLLAGYVRSENRAALMSFNRWVSQLGQAFGPMLMGLAFAMYHLNGVFYTAAGIGALTSVVAIIIVPKNEKNG